VFYLKSFINTKGCSEFLINKILSNIQWNLKVFSKSLKVSNKIRARFI